MPSIRRTGLFTPAELRRRLPRRSDKLNGAVAAFLDATLAFGTTWAFLQDGAVVVIRLGRAHVLRFHTGDGRPTDGATEASLRFENSGASTATCRDFAEIAVTLTSWGLSRRPGAAA